jgi:hypothetical protein
MTWIFVVREISGTSYLTMQNVPRSRFLRRFFAKTFSEITEKWSKSMKKQMGNLQTLPFNCQFFCRKMSYYES